MSRVALFHREVTEEGLRQMGEKEGMAEELGRYKALDELCRGQIRSRPPPQSRRNVES